MDPISRDMLNRVADEWLQQLEQPRARRFIHLTRICTAIEHRATQRDLGVSMRYENFSHAESMRRVAHLNDLVRKTDDNTMTANKIRHLAEERNPSTFLLRARGSQSLAKCGRVVAHGQALALREADYADDQQRSALAVGLSGTCFHQMRHPTQPQSVPSAKENVSLDGIVGIPIVPPAGNTTAALAPIALIRRQGVGAKSGLTPLAAVVGDRKPPAFGTLRQNLAALDGETRILQSMDLDKHTRMKLLDRCRVRMEQRLTNSQGVKTSINWHKLNKDLKKRYTTGLNSRLMETDEVQALDQAEGSVAKSLDGSTYSAIYGFTSQDVPLITVSGPNGNVVVADPDYFLAAAWAGSECAWYKYMLLRFQLVFDVYGNVTNQFSQEQERQFILAEFDVDQAYKRCHGAPIFISLDSEAAVDFYRACFHLADPDVLDKLLMDPKSDYQRVDEPGDIFDLGGLRVVYRSSRATGSGVRQPPPYCPATTSPTRAGGWASRPIRWEMEGFIALYFFGGLLLGATSGIRILETATVLATVAVAPIRVGIGLIGSIILAHATSALSTALGWGALGVAASLTIHTVWNKYILPSLPTLGTIKENTTSGNTTKAEDVPKVKMLADAFNTIINQGAVEWIRPENKENGVPDEIKTLMGKLIQEKLIKAPENPNSTVSMATALKELINTKSLSYDQVLEVAKALTTHVKDSNSVLSWATFEKNYLTPTPTGDPSIQAICNTSNVGPNNKTFVENACTLLSPPNTTSTNTAPVSATNSSDTSANASTTAFLPTVLDELVKSRHSSNFDAILDQAVKNLESTIARYKGNGGDTSPIGAMSAIWEALLKFRSHEAYGSIMYRTTMSFHAVLVSGAETLHHYFPHNTVINQWLSTLCREDNYFLERTLAFDMVAYFLPAVFESILPNYWGIPAIASSLVAILASSAAALLISELDARRRDLEVRTMRLFQITLNDNAGGGFAGNDPAAYLRYVSTAQGNLGRFLWFIPTNWPSKNILNFWQSASNREAAAMIMTTPYTTKRVLTILGLGFIKNALVAGAAAYATYMAWHPLFNHLHWLSAQLTLLPSLIPDTEWGSVVTSIAGFAFFFIGMLETNGHLNLLKGIFSVAVRILWGLFAPSLVRIGAVYSKFMTTSDGTTEVAVALASEFDTPLEPMDKQETKGMRDLLVAQTATFLGSWQYAPRPTTMPAAMPAAINEGRLTQDTTLVSRRFNSVRDASRNNIPTAADRQALAKKALTSWAKRSQENAAKAGLINAGLLVPPRHDEDDDDDGGWVTPYPFYTPYDDLQIAAAMAPMPEPQLVYPNVAAGGRRVSWSEIITSAMADIGHARILKHLLRGHGSIIQGRDSRLRIDTLYTDLVTDFF